MHEHLKIVSIEYIFVSSVEVSIVASSHSFKLVDQMPCEIVHAFKKLICLDRDRIVSLEIFMPLGGTLDVAVVFLVS